MFLMCRDVDVITRLQLLVSPSIDNRRRLAARLPIRVALDCTRIPPRRVTMGYDPLDAHAIRFEQSSKQFAWQMGRYIVKQIAKYWRLRIQRSRSPLRLFLWANRARLLTKTKASRTVLELVPGQ